MCRSTPLPVMVVVTAAGAAGGWAIAVLRDRLAGRSGARPDESKSESGSPAGPARSSGSAENSAEDSSSASGDGTSRPSGDGEGTAP